MNEFVSTLASHKSCRKQRSTLPISRQISSQLYMLWGRRWSISSGTSPNSALLVHLVLVTDEPSEDLGRRLGRVVEERRRGVHGTQTLVEVGAGVWVDAEMWAMNLTGKVLADVSRPDTSVVTIDIGLDLHVEMEIEQALAFCTRRVEVLRKWVQEFRFEGGNRICYWCEQEEGGCAGQRGRPCLADWTGGSSGWSYYGWAEDADDQFEGALGDVGVLV
jgi:hypothetical protein